MAVGSVDHDCVDTGAHESLGALHGVGGDTDTGSHAQTRVFARCRFVFGFGDILICNKADELAVGVDNGQLLDLVVLEDVGSLLEGCAERGCHEVLASHHLVDTAALVALEAEVAVSDDTYELAALVYHGNAADVVFAHHAESVGHGRAFKDGDRVVNHAVFGTLYSMHLTGLLFYRHVFVNNAQAALACDRYGKLTLGHCVHSRRYDGYVERYVAREARSEVDFAWKYV